MQAALGRVGCELPLYHAKLSAGERDRILGRFSGWLDPPLKAVICTSAFSMGLDVADVRAVIKWQHPSAVEDYLQEFGRSGRDGRPALSLLFGDGGRESGLLQWMPNKTAEDVVSENKRTYAQAQETLRGKTDRRDGPADRTADALLSRRAHRSARRPADHAAPHAGAAHRGLGILDTHARTQRRCVLRLLQPRARHAASRRRVHPRYGWPRHREAATTPPRAPEWRGWRAATATVAALTLGLGIIALTAGSSGENDHGAVARDTFERYTAAGIRSSQRDVWLRLDLQASARATRRLGSAPPGY